MNCDRLPARGSIGSTSTRSSLARAQVLLVILGLCLVVAAGGVLALDGSFTAAEDDVQTANASAASGGEQFAATVEGERHHLSAEVGDDRFVHRYQAAESDAERAALVATTYEDSTTAYEELDSDLDDLTEAREEGSVSSGEYYARLRVLEARQRALLRTTNTTIRAAEGLSAAELAAAGVSVADLLALEAQIEALGVRLHEIAPALGVSVVGDDLLDDDDLLDRDTTIDTGDFDDVFGDGGDPIDDGLDLDGNETIGDLLEAGTIDRDERIGDLLGDATIDEDDFDLIAFDEDDTIGDLLEDGTIDEDDRLDDLADRLAEDGIDEDETIGDLLEAGVLEEDDPATVLFDEDELDLLGLGEDDTIGDMLEDGTIDEDDPIGDFEDDGDGLLDL